MSGRQEELLEVLSARLEVHRHEESVHITIPRNARLIAFFAVMWLAIHALASIVLRSVPLPSFLLFFVFSAHSIVREHIELHPEGLYCRGFGWPIRKDRTLAWALIQHIEPARNPGWLRHGVQFNYEAAPFLGSKFLIGQNLSREESEALGALLAEYRGSAMAHTLEGSTALNS